MKYPRMFHLGNLLLFLQKYTTVSSLEASDEIPKQAFFFSSAEVLTIETFNGISLDHEGHLLSGGISDASAVS